MNIYTLKMLPNADIINFLTFRNKFCNKTSLKPSELFNYNTDLNLVNYGFTFNDDFYQ